ncbi:MAG: hypothetical protein JWQ09_4844 [Segetibacter sp.]|nr:hypothetical protein [Segetibacter sp.]
MPKENNFYSAIMSFQSVINQYYPEPGNSDFHHFVLQQMIADGSKHNDDFILIAYAISANGAVLNGEAPYQLSVDSNTPPFAASKQKVQFANMKLDVEDLDELYPENSEDNDLIISPTGYYNETGYIVYTVKQNSGGLTTSAGSVTLNPSPPA